MKTVAVGVFLLLSSFAALAQGEEDFEYYRKADSTVNEKGATSVHLTTGSSITSNSNGGTAVSTYIAPFISHQLSPRWRLSTGTAMVHSSFDGWTTYSLDNRLRNYNGQTTYQQLFIRADYQASEKVTLSGAVYHHILSLDPAPGNASLSIPGNSYMLGMEYQLAPGLVFGIQVRQSRGAGGIGSPYFPGQTGIGAFNNGFGTFGSW